MRDGYLCGAQESSGVRHDARASVVIVGAGISGCVIAVQLASSGQPILILERQNRVGGLARTFHYGDFSFDIGPHRFYTAQKDIAEYVTRVLGSRFQVIPRKSGVYFRGKYYSWPLRPSILFDLSPVVLAKVCKELFSLHGVHKKKTTDTFRDYILQHYGPTLYSIFFKEYTEKFLDLSPELTHCDWAREAMKRTVIDERMGSRNLVDLLKLTFMFRPLRTEFIYPHGGIGSFCNNIAAQFRVGKQTTVKCGAEVENIVCASGRIREVSTQGERVALEHLVWTGDLRSLCRLLGIADQGLRYRDMVLYNIEVKKPLQRNYQWCYYGNRKVTFSRITAPSRFGKDMAPEGKDSVCVEIPCYEGDVWWREPEHLTGKVVNDLVSVGLVKNFGEIANVHIERVPQAYPLYMRDYLQRLQQVKGDLSAIKNLTLAGRTALFWYNNMDDSIANGITVAQRLYQKVAEFRHR